MRIRLERNLRDEFLQVCRAQDLPAAQVIRAFMRDYVKKQNAVQEQDGNVNDKS